MMWLARGEIDQLRFEEQRNALLTQR